MLSKPGGGTGDEQRPGLALLDVMFGSKQPHFAAAAPKWKPFNTRLDASQVCVCVTSQNFVLQQCWDYLGLLLHASCALQVSLPQCKALYLQLVLIPCWFSLCLA